MTRTRIFSVTVHDCEVQHFRSGGKGGQNQNKRDTGTRIIHHPSGARGEARDERSQLQNKKLAFRRMAESPTFRVWLMRELGQQAVLETQLQIPAHDVQIEVRKGGKWTVVSEEDLT